MRANGITVPLQFPFMRKVQVPRPLLDRFQTYKANFGASLVDGAN